MSKKDDKVLTSIEGTGNKRQPDSKIVSVQESNAKDFDAILKGKAKNN